ncbi:MAG TPA: response regulator transcription factor [Kribbella sp.]
MRLMVCDDQWLFATALTTALIRRGHQVEATSEPEVLLDQVARFHPDLCLLDGVLGALSGVEVAYRLRRVMPRPAVVLLTGSCDEQVWDAYGRGLLNGIVNKACTFGALEDTIRRVAIGERVVEGWSATSDRTTESRPVVESLTGRELEVLRLVVQGLPTRTMASLLGVSTHTVRTHVQQVLRKLGVHGRGKVARAAVEAGLVDIEALAVSSAQSHSVR